MKGHHANLSGRGAHFNPHSGVGGGGCLSWFLALATIGAALFYAWSQSR